MAIPPQTRNEPVLTVSQITNAIKLQLEGAFPVVFIQGEVSNFVKQSSGHLYFSLKDEGAQISAVAFRQDAAKFLTQPLNGQKVIVKGAINVYPVSGKYQITVKELRPIGIGELLIKLEELKRKLHQLGWFKKERKRELPKFPKVIGVVTSPTGAAIQDILNILSRRFSGFHLILNPVKVQQKGAAEEIAEAIRQFNKYNLVDVMIVGRGGGSMEDLFAFNEEVVADAIYHSKIPVISAVGHEIDHCIADYVADFRAPTPSAAAEIVMGEKAQYLHHLAEIRQKLQLMLKRKIGELKQKLKGIQKQPCFSSPYFLLGSSMQRLDEIKTSLNLAMQKKISHYKVLLEGRKKTADALQPKAKITHYRYSLLQLSNALDLAIKRRLDKPKERIAHIRDQLKSINPKNLLERGYSIVLKADVDDQKGFTAIDSVKHLKLGDKINIMFADGSASSIINEINPSVTR